MESPFARSLFTAALVLTFSQVASAHPGHVAGTGLVSGLAHPFAGLDHLLAMIAVGSLAVRVGGRALGALPVAFMSLMILGGLLPLADGRVPPPEQGAASSVMRLGVLLAPGTKGPT